MSSSGKDSPRLVRARAGLLAVLVAAGLSCGDYFPNQYLLSGDDIVLKASPFGFGTLVEPLIPATVGTIESLPKTPYAYVEKDSDDGSDLAAARKAGSAYLGEFELYAQGRALFHSKDSAGARAVWERLLALPAAQRTYRSTWASYMLGRSWHAEDPSRAASYYRQTRELASRGFSDSLGLATASIGWEAKLAYDRLDLGRAIRFYLEHAAAKDPTAIASLWRCGNSVHKLDDAKLDELAAETWSRRVVTAWMVSEYRFEAEYVDTAARARPAGFGARWIAAVERAGASEVVFADIIAWAAYQSGQFEIARRWAHQAGDGAPRAVWIRAKLALRDGRLAESTKLLSKAVRALPPETPWMDRERRGEPHCLPGKESAAGEAGVLLLTAREYEEAIDTFLIGFHWEEAAYIAECVFTTDELVAYVDRQWTERRVNDESDTSRVASSIRHLLARRLARDGDYLRARPYFPANLRPSIDRLATCLAEGRDAKRTKSDRARALLEAARITRHRGLAIFGTELAPDYAMHDGLFAPQEMLKARLAMPGARWTAVQPEEERRVKESALEPARRFHYRYSGCDLAWEAASLLPNESEQTAAILCEAGTWIKVLDPKAADRFYKAMVTRCGRTRLGKEANALRWFPALDKGELAFVESMPDEAGGS